jgi:hypothetical protein
MAARSTEQRVDRLGQVMDVIAEDHLAQEEATLAVKWAIAELATETRRGFDQVAKQFAETDRRIRENDVKTQKLFQETDARMRDTDARIEKLVVAIGKFVSQKH